MEKYSHIIWDFNGTLYDDVDVCLSCGRRLMRAHGLEPIGSLEEYRAIFGFPIIDYYARMGFDFEKTPYSELAVEWVAYYLERSKSSALYPDVVASLERVKAAGMAQLILSASQREMLRGQVQSLGILPYFDDLLGLDNIHAHSKQEIGKAWRERTPNARPLLIGDTEHDAEVAAAMGADCILIGCGHRPKAALQSCKPLWVANSITEALDHIL